MIMTLQQLADCVTASFRRSFDEVWHVILVMFSSCYLLLFSFSPVRYKSRHEVMFHFLDFFLLSGGLLDCKVFGLFSTLPIFNANLNNT